MILIYKTNEIYHHSTINEITVEQWKKANKTIPHDFVIAVDKEHNLYEKLINSTNYEPVIKKGELIDVIELPPPEISETEAISNQINVLKANLQKDDKNVLEKIEQYLLKGGVEGDLKTVLEERANTRSEINSLQAQLL